MARQRAPLPGVTGRLSASDSEFPEGTGFSARSIEYPRQLGVVSVGARARDGGRGKRDGRERGVVAVRATGAERERGGEIGGSWGCVGGGADGCGEEVERDGVEWAFD